MGGDPLPDEPRDVRALDRAALADAHPKGVSARVDAPGDRGVDRGELGGVAVNACLCAGARARERMLVALVGAV